MCETAMRRMVSLSGLRASVEHVGTMSHSSLIYVVILLRRRRSISQCDSLSAGVLAQEESVKRSHTQLKLSNCLAEQNRPDDKDKLESDQCEHVQTTHCGVVRHIQNTSEHF